MGPLLSMTADRTETVTARGSSSATPQARVRTDTGGSGIAGPRGEEGAAQAALQAPHDAAVGLVVVAQAVEDAVEQQHLELALGVVAGRRRLPARRRHRDQHVPQVGALLPGLAGERQHVGRPLLAAEL